MFTQQQQQQSSLASPSPVTILDAAQFRLKLAGLADPLGPQGGPGARENLKQAASRLCAILASLYDVSDDRTQLWGHIGKALDVADEKTANDDIEHFLSECLASIQADPGRAAASDALTSLAMEMAAWPPEQRHEFVQYVRSHRYTVLTFGRARWESVKSGEVAL